MTRSFENEYKKYADSTVPDLWGRIEAAIDEKSSSNVTQLEETVKDREETKKTVRFPVRRIAGIAGIAAGVLLSIGALRMIAGGKSTASESAMPMMDSAPVAEDISEAASEAAAEPDIDYAAEAESDEMAVAESAEPAMAEAAEEPMADGAAEPDMNFAAEAPAAAAESGDEYADNAEYEEAATDEDRKSAKSEGYAVAAASITAVCTIEDMSKLESAHTITVKISDPLKSGLEKGSEMKVEVDADIQKQLLEMSDFEKAGLFTATIEPENAGKYRLLEILTKK